MTLKMRLPACVLVTILSIGCLTAQDKKPGPFMRNDDRIFLSEQFLRWFFPQLGGRDAELDIHVNMRVRGFNDLSQHAIPQSPVAFSVTDWCVPTPEPGPHIFDPRPGYPCVKYDKSYKDPLWGEIHFTTRNGHIVPVEGWFDGAFFDPPGPCFGGNPAGSADIVKRVHPDRLSMFFGNKVIISKVVKETDGAPWTVWMELSTRSVRRPLYAVYLNECGLIESFAQRN